MAIATKEWKEAVLKRLKDIRDKNGKIPQYVAEVVISKSAWWELHPSGPVRARGCAKNIEGNNGSWYITYGANSFQISIALDRCIASIRGWVQQQTGEISKNSWEKIYALLVRNLRSSVTNFNGEEYNCYRGGYNKGDNNIISFGTHSIRINDFIKVIGE
jgi:hypothetical protein